MRGGGSPRGGPQFLMRGRIHASCVSVLTKNSGSIGSHAQGRRVSTGQL